MESKGLGGTIEKITTATGIKTVVDKVSEGLNIPCGCQKRKEALELLEKGGNTKHTNQGFAERRSK